MELLHYKGYVASVEVDLEAGILYGRVLYLRDGIDFQAERVADLQREFEASVEDYLAWCQEDGREADKPFSGKFVVRLDPVLHREAAIASTREGVSLNEWVKMAVAEKLASRKEAPRSKPLKPSGKLQDIVSKSGGQVIERRTLSVGGLVLNLDVVAGTAMSN